MLFLTYDIFNIYGFWCDSGRAHGSYNDSGHTISEWNEWQKSMINQCLRVGLLSV